MFLQHIVANSHLGHEHEIERARTLLTRFPQTDIRGGEWSSVTSSA
jgi:hypothetical protein